MQQKPSSEAQVRTARAQLRSLLSTRFSVSELQDLCFDLAIDYEVLPGYGKSDKARELVLYVERYNKLVELVAHCQMIRPDLDWPTKVASVPLERAKQEGFIYHEDENLFAHEFYSGGPLSGQFLGLYIKREADVKVVESLKLNECVIISEPKKQGKTSLINYVCGHSDLWYMYFVRVSLPTDMKGIKSERDWYRELCNDIQDQLVQKMPEIKNIRIAKDHETWISFITQIARHVAQDQRVVIVIDDIRIKQVEALPVIFSKFFLSIKQIFNSARSGKPYLKRVIFLLVGTFRLSQLIQEGGESFDIGVRVRLKDFEPDEIKQLMCVGGVKGLGLSELSRYIHDWTSGQPFYVQVLCSQLGSNATKEDVDSKAVSMMHDLEYHFQPMIRDLESGVMRYRPVIMALRQSPVIAFELYREAILDLELMGLLGKRNDGQYCVRNKFWQQLLSEINWEGVDSKLIRPLAREPEVTVASVIEEQKYQHEMLDALKGREKVLEQIQASEGVFKDPKIQIEIDEVREKIRRCMRILQGPGPIVLEFRPKKGAATITWRSDLLGREETRFVSPYRAAHLPVVIRALNALQYAHYPAWRNDAERQIFEFEVEDQALLSAHGLWCNNQIAPDAPQIIGNALLAGLGAKGQELIKRERNYAIREQAQLSYVLRFPPLAIALAALPWELLWDKVNNESIFIRGTTVDSCERYMDLDRAIAPPRPVRAKPLLLALLPRYGISETIRDSERDARLRTWNTLRDQGKIDYVEMNHVTVPRLNRAFPSGSRRPDIIHYYGHGTYRDRKGYLCFDQEYGGDDADLVSTERLSSLLGDCRLIVLHACESAIIDVRDGLLTGIAPALSLVADAVVAMQLTVPAIVATRFLEVFYEQLLGRGLSLQKAVAEARRVLFTELHGWYVPTLYIRSHEQKPFYLIDQD